MSDPGKAVFLSYASQDAEAAKRICDALRAAGVEVWFDAEGGLEHGDEWDAKIRRQIKECVLFLPIISASTQAREEGYFRIEWELAAQRALGIASGVAFILPIVIDDTREPDALVPDRFRTVQWTRLRGGELTPEVKARFLKLWSHRAGMVKHLSEASTVGASLDDARGRGQAAPLQGTFAKPSWKVYAGLAVAIFSLVAVVGWWMLRRDPPAVPPPVVPPPVVGAGSAVGPAPTASVRDWPKDLELKKAFALLTRIDMIPEDIRLAEEICQHALDKASTNPEVVGMAAAAQSMWLLRGWDRSNDRFLKAQRLAERALQLSPDEPEAMLAMAIYLYQRGTGLERAHELMARAIELNPNEPRYHRLRDNLLFVDPAVPREKALASAVQTAARFPRDALVRYELGRFYRNSGRWEDFERETDAALALAPVANALVWKARAQGILHRDHTGMKATLDRVPDRVRTIERTVYAYFLYSVMSGSLGEGIAALNGMPDSWMIDFDYLGPKALPLAALLELQGKPSLARLQYEVALEEIKKHQVEAPEDAGLWLNQAFVLHGLGRDQEARAILKVYLESLQRPYRISQMASWWFHVVPGCLLLGERTMALELMREAVEGPAGRATLRARMAGDPRMAPFRDDPEIKALLAEPAMKTEDRGQTSHGSGRATGPGPAAPRQARGLEPAETAADNGKPEVGVSIDQKSVAVLAFANLSDDKANEYFSDGISEELLNVLAKVPKLKVAARTSSFHFKGKDTPIPEIARQLGVAYVVEGSVRKAGNKVRVTAQLIKAADGFHVWSETYDRDLTDIFAVQDEIAKNILGVVKGSVLGEAELPHATTTNLAAYTLYLQAQGAFATRSDAGLHEAVRLFEASLRIDPDYVPALVGLAFARVVLPSYVSIFGPEARGLFEGAKQAAQRALELDPRNAGALTVIGCVLYTAEWRWKEGEAVMLRARKSAPHDALVENFFGDYYRWIGDSAQAVAAKRLAWELDPLRAGSHWDLGYTYLAARDYDQALHWGELALKLAPHNLDPYYVIILAAAHSGRFDLMRQTIAAARQNVHENNGMRLLLEAHAAILAKTPDEARRVLTAATGLVERGEASPAYLGYCHLLLGDSEQAMRWLQRGYDLRDIVITWSENIDFDVIAANPVTRPILDQPGLKELYELRQSNARAGLSKL